MAGFEIVPDEHMGIGSVLSRTFSTLGQNPLLFFGLAALVQLPLVLADLLFPEIALRSTLASSTAFLGVLVEGAIAVGVFKTMQGQAVSFGEALRPALNKISALTAAAFLVILGVTLGLILLVIPGLMLACALAVTFQSCLAEDLGALDSLKRSLELTRGHRSRIFALGFLVALGTALGALVAAFVIGYALPHLFLEQAQFWLSFILTILLVAVIDILAAIIYYDLRALAEGLTVEALAQVFD